MLELVPNVDGFEADPAVSVIAPVLLVTTPSVAIAKLRIPVAVTPDPLTGSASAANVGGKPAVSLALTTTANV